MAGIRCNSRVTIRQQIARTVPQLQKPVGCLLHRPRGEAAVTGLQTTGISESRKGILTSSARTERASPLSWAPEDYWWGRNTDRHAEVLQWRCVQTLRHVSQISTGPSRCGDGVGACTRWRKLPTSPRGARADKSPRKWRQLTGFRTYIYNEKSSPAIQESFTEEK